MFITIHDGDTTLNLNQAVKIEWGKDGATVTMSNGEKFDVDDEKELKVLKAMVK